MPTFQAETPRPILQYDGRIVDLYRIFLINLLLNIVTIGIWRFWAITRTRRYVWSRTSLCGSRFEYDGTGGQLFVGFLLAILLIAGMALLAVLLSLALRGAGLAISGLPIALFEFCFVILALGAPFSAQRYRLGHTVWRGIRGGMQGSMLAYGLRSMLYFLLVAITFYQLAPWATLRLLERRINASAFGNLRFTSRGKPGQLYLRFVLTFAAIVGLVLVIAAAEWAFGRGVINTLLQQAPGQPMDPHIARRLVVVLLPAYLVFVLGAAIISASYAAAFSRHVAGHTTLAGLHFSSRVNAGTVLGLVLGNALILVLTLGLGVPFVIQRNARYFTTNLLAAGTLDFDTIGQSEQPVSRYGEGMFQALDAGAGIT
jgi:uncharacterized membrane protein YjgN (DUF898 family)